MGNERFIFWFWESPTTGWHTCKVKEHFHCLIICIYFYLTCSTTPKLFAQRLIFPNPSFAWRQGRPLGGATGAVVPGPALWGGPVVNIPRGTPPPPPRKAIANGLWGAPLPTSHRAPRQLGTALRDANLRWLVRLVSFPFHHVSL